MTVQTTGTPSRRPPYWRHAAVAAALYLVLGAVWILGSDALVEAVAPDMRWLSRLQSAKGVVYVVLTAAIAAWLLARADKAQRERDDAADDAASMLDAANVGLARVTLAGRFLWVNDHLADLLGRTPDELRTLDFQKVTHPDDLEIDLAQMQSLLDGKATRYKLQKRYLRPDGTTMTAMLAVTLVRDAAGVPRWFVSAVQDIGELKAVQDRLALAEQRLVDFIHALPDPVAVRDTQGRYLLANPATLALIGRSMREVIGQPVDALFSAKRAALVRDTDRRALEVGGLAPFKSVIRQGGSGSKRWLEVRISVLRDRTGHVAGLLSVSRDITELHEREMALEQSLAEQRELHLEAQRQRRALLSALEDADRSKQRLQAVVAALPDLVFLFDADGRFIEVWAADPSHLMMPREQLLGRRFDEMLPADLARRAMAHLCAVLDGGGLQSFEYTLALTAGERNFEMRMCLSGAGQVLAVARDVTAEHAARQALARTEQRMRLALEASGDGWWDWDLRTGEVEYSDGFHRLLRHPGDRFAAPFKFVDLLHPEDAAGVQAAVKATIETGAAYSRTYRLRCYDGEYRWFLARGGIYRGPDGRTARFSGVLSDQSERLRADERQRLAAAVFDHTQEGVVITDSQERIVSANPAITAMLGYREEDLVGHTPRLLASGQHPPEFFTAMWHSIAQHGHWQGEVVNCTRDGRQVPQLMSISAVRDDRQRVTHYVGVFNDITQLKQTEARLDFLAHHDALTTLPNRLLFSHRLEQALDNARRNAQKVAVLLLDLDHFKEVNDSWGHATGDAMLQKVAQRLRPRLRRTDTLARLGGDEFALVMTELRDASDAARLAVELQESLAEPWRTESGLELTAAASIGIALFPDHGDLPPDLLAHADAALYRAKADGRGVYRFYADEMTAAARSRLSLEARLKRALKEGQLTLQWQPQVDMAARRIVGAEAQVRWHDPSEGLIAPQAFMPVAEASGLIADLGTWVLGQACRQGRQWIEAGFAPPVVAVSLSARQFQLGDLVAQVEHELSTNALPPDCLQLQIPETMVTSRKGEVPTALVRLRALGVRLAIDDFGTGDSSLASLARAPVQQLNIDRSLTGSGRDNLGGMDVAAAAIAMGHSLGLTVLAKGVETTGQLERLSQKGCDRCQGSMTGPPVSAQALELLLRDQKSSAR